MSYPQLREYIIILNRKDNVGVALKDIPEGKYALNYEGEESHLTLKERIRAGFKISLQYIKQNDMIYKYGHVIGIAQRNIKSGEKVHIHNMGGLIKNERKGLIANDS